MECGIYFAEPDTILVFKIFYELFGGGTRLAMPKTICAPDSSSLKPGSGATEGVLVRGCPDGTLLGVEGKLGDSDVDLLLCKPTLCNPSPLRCLYKPDGCSP